MTTIAQVFASKKLWPWFNSAVTNYYNGSAEKGQDYSTTFGTPVAVPVGGKILRIVHNANSIGDVVELQDNSGAVWLYQHIDAKVRVGQTLQCGSVIGLEDGLPVDQYSTGPHIEVRYCPSGWSAGIDSWSEPWVNPKTIFGSIGDQQAGTVAAGNPLDYLANAVTGQNGKTPITLAPDADVSALLVTMDQLLLITDPFKISGVQQDTIGGLTFTDPVGWAQQLGQNLLDDASAIFLRGIFMILGLYIFAKVLGNFIDFGAVAQTVSSGVQTAGKAAALLA